MRVLVVDNYDSFSHNVVQALGVLGADVIVRRNDAIDVRGALDLRPAAVVLSPGPCTPAEAGVSVALVRAAASEGVPLLGVCLGHQALGAAIGGEGVRAGRLRHGKTSRVHHDGRGVFEGLPDPLTVMRYHSLVVARPLPPGLVATAWVRRDEAPDVLRDDELMGLRHATLPIEGVQFHPESFLTPEGPRLLANFLARSRRTEVIP